MNRPWWPRLAALSVALFSGLVAASPKEPIRLALIEGLSGPFANAGEAVERNLLMAVERVNARGGVRLADGMHALELVRYDSKGQVDEALSMLKAATGQGARFVLQGNSSAVAAALVDALDKHNEREPGSRALLLNYSAVDPQLTQSRCSFWHFRFDAHADMRMAALTEVMRADTRLERVYLIGQDYSFGRQVLQSARSMLAAKRPDVRIVGEELHPIGRIKDFLPYALKIKASGAQAVVTGNWGNDLTLLVRAAREVGLEAKFYTFYGNGLGAPAAIGEAGVGRVVAVAEWHPNAGGAASDRFVEAFRARFPRPQDDYQHVRMHAMVELLAAALERAEKADAVTVARALEGLRFDPRTLGGLHEGWIRAADHQFVQPLYVSVMARAGEPGVRFDNEGSGWGFKTLRFVSPAQTEPPQRCLMRRP
ncbi:branched-chain amino acid ABC transporter substrate-binding protein [Caldimonas sp. KR1-144]|uniref:branched-chain amino acid ABC transporter substrate-binding protein n=1 Tax=Caldimonas sp. KR1-144 TaxID=3400911 RepID=UPI003BFD3A59